MAADETISRRNLLKQCLLATVLAPVAAARPRTVYAADAPLLSAADPAAIKVKYTAEAGAAKGVPPGNRCANCALYGGAYTSTQGPCQIFPGKQVKAAGWCSSWAPQI